ncbi:MAG: type VI secretion system tube protein Hcp [Burkholderiaceae bacterium]|nr:MAG: type VI secretion system tube protein Hcp [Burkholderiaceae bacterium]
MAVDIHIKIDTIPGQSEHKGFEGQIQVENFSWAMNQVTNFGSATGGGAGKVNLGDLTFTHYVDKATPKLMIACCTGAHLKDAVLTCRKAGGESGVDFFKITLTDVIVSSVSPAGSNGGDTPIEAISLAFAEYKVEFQEQDNKGAKKGGPVIAGFNVQKNAKTA